MKILLDECVTIRLKSFLAEHLVYSVGQMEWRGLKNGILLKKAEQENFDIFLTIDKNIGFQQNTSQYKISIVVLNSSNSNIEALLGFIPAFLAQIQNFEKGKINILEKD